MEDCVFDKMASVQIYPSARLAYSSFRIWLTYCLLAYSRARLLLTISSVACGSSSLLSPQALVSLLSALYPIYIYTFAPIALLSRSSSIHNITYRTLRQSISLTSYYRVQKVVGARGYTYIGRERQEQEINPRR